MRRILRGLFLFLLGNALAIWAAHSFFGTYIDITSEPMWKGYVLIGVVMGLLNTFVKPILKLITLPFLLLTMGLFLVVINAFLLFITEWVFANILDAIGVDMVIKESFAGYIVVGFALALINGILHWILKK